MGVWEEQSASVQKTNDLSAQPCGCDPRCNWICDWHKVNDGDPLFATEAPKSISFKGIELRFPDPRIESHDAKLTGIADSGKRMVFASGSMRDPSEGKIKWSRITFGPLLRRWALHLTKAEAKYPDPTPGVPNFSLIETEEEYIRYKESAMRHFMSWFYDETDEDHAVATMFNMNGVEIIKAKRRGEKLPTFRDGLGEQR